MHGEIYTKAKLFRYNLIDSPNCSRCGAIEDLKHKMFNCEYARRIWGKTLEVTNALRVTPINQNNPDSYVPEVLLAITDTCPVLLAIHAEICQRILALKDEAQYLVRPKLIVENVVKYLYKKEQKATIKDQLGNLLQGD